MLGYKYSFKTCLMIILFNLFIVSKVFAAGIWSEPTYTEQWSVPEATEQWSEPQPKVEPKPIVDTQPIVTHDSTSNPSTYIELQMGNKNAKVQGKIVQLDVAPAAINGSTMVPIRFLGENMNIQVGWQEATQKISLSLKGKEIVLSIGKNTAVVNGKQVQLDSPPIKKDGRTLVPLRFISENLDLFVKYTSATKAIEISDKPILADSSLEAPVGPVINHEAALEFDQIVLDFKQLYGTWYLWTQGQVTDLYDKTTGGYVTHDYDAGKDQGKVVINQDGTYTMTHAAWAKGVTVKGKWRLSYPSEINGDSIIAIVLLNGITDVNWAVAPSPNGKIRLMWEMGPSTWIMDTELYKK